jgi:hypothetical protein
MILKQFVSRLPPKAPVLPFKNDGSFLEKFRQMQQQTANSSVHHTAVSPSLHANYSCPPPIDVSVPPPHTLSNPYFIQHPPPPSYLTAPPVMNIKEEVKEENRSPSPYSPSRPCEDEDDLTFFNKGECSTCIWEWEQKCWILGSLHQSSTHGFPSFSIRLPSSRAVELVRGLGKFLSKVFLICQETHHLNKLRCYFI